MSWSVYFIAVALAAGGVAVLEAGGPAWLGGSLVGLAVFLGRLSGDLKGAA